MSNETEIVTDSKKSETEVESKKGKGGKIVLVLCILLIFVLIGVIIYLLMNKDEDEKKRNVVVTEENVEDVVAQLSDQQKVPVGSYQVTQNPTWKFPDGTSASTNAYIENTGTNNNSVYFDVALTETEEIIYESPILPVGSHLENITLDKDLDSGEYDAVVIYHILDNSGESMSTVRVGITIVVNN